MIFMHKIELRKIPMLDVASLCDVCCASSSSAVSITYSRITESILAKISKGLCLDESNSRDNNLLTYLALLRSQKNVPYFISRFSFLPYPRVSATALKANNKHAVSPHMHVFDIAASRLRAWGMADLSGIP